MADWFTAEQRLALIRKYRLDGPKTPEQMAIEEACELSPEVRELWAMRDTWLDRDEFAQLLWPRVFRVLGVTAGLEDDEPAAELPARGGPQEKWEGKPIPHETFWELFRLAVQEDASARALENLTDKRDDLEFVNRNKAGNIVKWVKSHPTLSRRAVDRHELPREFRATLDGVFPPTL
jgi:hypothetical protein